ncbi:hypothetical protein WA026_022504 [Henosepilachna vigintioctopunctata]|uniref:Uncharacterized protein n=1 Tax=Henosepilachna vigintioctopunctata TaxID=420089 RepID=A0AAW1UHW3_9CUCU
MRAKMLFVISLLWVQKATARPRCGGSFTAARGVIQTPGFPGPFSTPIHCEWVIDAQHLLSKNTSIVVYLTQLFVFEGLKFTEYQVYDESFRFNGRDLLVVNETNVVDAKMVQTNQTYLVISLKLPTLDGTHLRVLDHYLHSFGFNATYEIGEGGVRSDACNMADCGFNGICYDHFNKFGCSCFENFTGRHCSDGPNSLCGTAKTGFCKNRGICRHVGATAVKCLCSEGFTGNACETSVSLGFTEKGKENVVLH